MAQSLVTWISSIIYALTKLTCIFLIPIVFRGLFWAINLFLLLPLFDPLQLLPGPDGKYLRSHLHELMRPSMSPDTHKVWVKQYGHTFRFHGFGKYDYRLLSFDLRAISHILTSPVYEKPWQTRNLLGRLIGRGIFSMEGKEHKRQRKIISPAFSGQCLKRMTPVMFRKAEELSEQWVDILSQRPQKYESFVPGTELKANSTINVARWVSRASFDVIGEAGFDYHFHALEEESEPVYMAYRRMFAIADKGINLRELMDLNFPWIRKIWSGKDNIVIDKSLKVINEAGKLLIANKKLSMNDEHCPSEKHDRDLLSLLIKSNMASDPAKRLTDQELLDQCSTFLLAGSDSVSTAISWALYFLSLDNSVQDRLRDELVDVSTCSFKASSHGDPLEERWDIVESLPFLDAVVRESLRLCPPVHETIRVAMEEDKIPISHPIQLRDGTHLNTGDHITIRKGSYIHIPIEGLNYSEELWGPDAQRFNPSRWFDLPPQTHSSAFPGLGNSMTFSFGPHSCLGYKFTTAEMKIFISTLITKFIFAPAPGIEIQKHNCILTRPFIEGKWELRPQLPLVVHQVHETSDSEGDVLT